MHAKLGSIHGGHPTGGIQTMHTAIHDGLWLALYERLVRLENLAHWPIPRLFLCVQTLPLYSAFCQSEAAFLFLSRPQTVAHSRSPTPSCVLMSPSGSRLRCTRASSQSVVLITQTKDKKLLKTLSEENWMRFSKQEWHDVKSKLAFPKLSRQFISVLTDDVIGASQHDFNITVAK